LDITKSLKKLENWIESWRKDDDSYNGIISTFWESNLDTVQANSVHQAPIIAAYLNLYQKTKNQTFFKRALRAANFLLNDLNPQTSVYRNIFADTPGKKAGPILNIECDLALLRLYKEHRQELKSPERYLNAVIVNVNNYLLKEWWNGKVWSNYVANQIAKGGELFLELYSLTNKNKYRNYALSMGKWLLDNQIKRGSFKGAFEQSSFDNRLVSAYEAACLPFLQKLYLETKDISYHQAYKQLVAFLQKNELATGGFVDFFEQSAVLKLLNLFLREIRILRPVLLPAKKKLLNSHLSRSLLIRKKEPIFIARLAEILLNITRANAQEAFNFNNHLNFILQNQLNSGGIKNCIGQTPSAGRKRWIQDVPVMRWNAFVFELLSSLLPEQLSYPDSLGEIQPSLEFVKGYGYLLENQKYLGFIRIQNNKITLERLFVKQENLPVIKDLKLGKKRNNPPFNKRKNILIITPSFPPETGGCSSRISDFVRFLNREKFKVHVITKALLTKPQTKTTEDTVINWIHLFVSFRKIWQFFFTVLYLAKYLIKNHIKVVIVTTPPGLHAALSMPLAKLLGRKLILDIRDPWIPSEVYSDRIQSGSLRYRVGIIIEKMLFYLANRISVTTGVITQLLVNKYRINPNKITVIPNGINLAIRDEVETLPDSPVLEKLKGKTVFLYQGLIARPQALDRILGFIPQILKKIPNAIFVFIGEGKEKQNLRNQVKQYGLEEVVLFLDKKPRKNVLAWIQKANYGIITLDDRFKYAIPSKTFEYLIFHKPIVAVVPTGGAVDKLLQKYGIGINLLREEMRELRPVQSANPIFKDYSRENNTRKLEELIGLKS